MKGKKSLYDVVGVDRGVSDEDLKKAYKDRAKELHPDKGGDGREMMELNKAYSVLKDKVRRDRYDRMGQEEEDSFEVRFSQLTQEIFMKLVEENDVDRKDLVEEFRKRVDRIIGEGNEAKKELSAGIKKMERVKKRLKGKEVDLIGRVVGINLEEKKRHLAMVEDQIEFMKKAKREIEGYKYEIEAPEEMKVKMDLRDPFPSWFRQTF